MTDQNEADFNVDTKNVTAVDNDNAEVLKKKNQDLQGLLGKVIDLLKEKTNVCINLEKQNSALNLQVNNLNYLVNFYIIVNNF